MKELPLISVVFISYNRAQTLVATYETFLEHVDYPRDRLELIISDDCSHSFHLNIINQLQFDIRCYSKKNLGLGANSNKGIKAATGDFIFHLQDDWITTGRASFLRETVECMLNNPEIGLILLRDWDFKYHNTLPRVPGCDNIVCLNENTEASEQRQYSDNPHLKRKDYHEKIGWYKENVKMTTMENIMTDKISKQKIYLSAVFLAPSPFKHIGERYSFNPGENYKLIKFVLRKLKLRN